jgi:hypothetical protein
MTKNLKFIFIAILAIPLFTNAQISTTPLAENYKVVNIGNNGKGDFARNLILLHEIYNGTLLPMNNAIGTITAFRGTTASLNRINVAEINSSSSYNGIAASIKSFDDEGIWKLKTCIYNGKKYLALDVPYSAAFHDWGFNFAGWTKSSGENMKSVPYELKGSPINTDILSNIQDYIPNINETHQVNNFLILGNKVGIGTLSPDEKLTVKGKIHTQEVRVDMEGPLVPDYVFENDYKLKTLQEVEDYIKENKHLPEIPSGKEIEKNGLMLAEMNMALLKKMEEMTLYMIDMKKENEEMKKNQKILEDRIQKIENK